MSGNLRARLARIRDRAGGPEGLDDSPDRPHGIPPGRTRPRPEGSGPGRDDFPDGWTTVADGLRFRETRTPMPGIEPGVEPGALIRLAAFSRRLDGLELEAGGLAFFDLETTGLSGGSGTVAFLAAFGRPMPDGTLAVRQYFIDDYPAEPAFIERVSAEIDSAAAIVSYNGSSFDLPLWSVRRSMNGFGPQAARPHVDVLHASRRLWKATLGDCSLGSVEAAVLGVGRIDDIPGAEVPEAWFDWVKRGRASRLARVFYHNELDVRSLAALFYAIGAAARGDSVPLRCDAPGLAEIQSRLDDGLAERTLRKALESGDRRAARPLMRLLLRGGRSAERVGLVPMLPDDAAGLFSKSVYAERVSGDRCEALRLAHLAAVAAREGGALAERARRRAARLESRLAGPAR